MSDPDLARERITDEDASTAFHEAGHAVAAALLGVAFLYVTIAPDADGDALGHVQYGGAAAPAGWLMERRAMRNRMRCNRAGPLAEERHAGQRNHIGAADDDYALWQQLAGAYGAQHERHARALTRDARRLLAANWGAVERVAAALMARGQLTFEEVAALVGRDQRA